jgi:hypothetical protein
MNSRLPAATRRLVLGTALAAALAAWLVPHATLVRAAAREPVALAQAAEPSAAEPKAVEPKTPAKAPAAKAPAKAAEPAPDAGAAPAAEAAKSADADADAADADAKSADKGTDITIDKRGIRVDKGKKRVHVQGFGSDHEYDSFESFVQDAPWLAGLVFLVVLLVFLVPLLIIVLLIWYKVRKNRMLNETMLKLAEKGVAPADAMAALDAGHGGTPPVNLPLYEQAKQFRQRAAASDLRKGVILVAVGLALSFFSIFDDGTPNSVGLVLLFLGIGYCILWYFEDRNPAGVAGRSAPPPAGGA